MIISFHNHKSYRGLSTQQGFAKEYSMPSKSDVIEENDVKRRKRGQKEELIAPSYPHQQTNFATIHTQP